MNFTFTLEQQNFRRELCTFLKENVPESEQTTHGYFSESQFAFSRKLYKRMALKRWLTIGWPEEFGGGGGEEPGRGEFLSDVLQGHTLFLSLSCCFAVLCCSVAVAPNLLVLMNSFISLSLSLSVSLSQ